MDRTQDRRGPTPGDDPDATLVALQTMLFFTRRDVRQASRIDARQLDAGYTIELWKPSWRSTRPHGLPVWPFAIWWLFHVLHVFANRDYAILCIRRHEMLAHRSCVFPRYWRFPFMAAADLQIGDTWTHPDQRGRGLATLALCRTIHELTRPGRAFWYITDQSNRASILAATRAGFELSGSGRRTVPFGVGWLGRFVLLSDSRSGSEKCEHAPSRPAPPAKNPANSYVVPREARLLGARDALLRRAPRA